LKYYEKFYGLNLNCEWLLRNMLASSEHRDELVASILRELSDHSVSLAHNRHLSAAKCKEIGLQIFDLESDQKLQEKVLSVHHIYFHTLSSTPAFKIIENQNGTAFIMQAQQVMVAAQPGRSQFGSLAPLPDQPTTPPNTVPSEA
jgi:hypothetical protein